MKSFCYFEFFLPIKLLHFVVLLCKVLLEFLPAPTCLACPIIWDNLCEVFTGSIVTDSISIIFGFSIGFDCRVIIFDRFASFVFFF